MIAGDRAYELSVVGATLRGEKSMTFWLPRVMALAAAFIGPLPYVLDMRFHIGMSSSAPVLWTASIILAAAAAILAYRWADSSVAAIVLVALIAGYMATATYDSTRVAGMSAGVTEMDEALDFGMRLAGQIAPGAGHGHDAHGGMEMAAEKGHSGGAAHGGASKSGEMASEKGHGGDTGHSDAPKAGGQHNEAHSQRSAAAPATTVALGYAWHYWAGMMFALGYLIIFGARRWWVAIPYTVLFIYPGMVFAMGFHSTANFIWEAIGHAAFGLTLGIVSWALLGRD